MPQAIFRLAAYFFGLIVLFLAYIPEKGVNGNGTDFARPLYFMGPIHSAADFRHWCLFDMAI